MSLLPSSPLIDLARHAWHALRRRLFPRRVYRKVPMRVRAPMANAEHPPPGIDWRACLATVEVDDAAPLAGALFRRRFGTRVPRTPRHFVLMYSATGDAGRREVVAYIHQQAVGGIYLVGGLCVDESAYRAFPKWLFAKVRAEGGLATLITRQSTALLGNAVAAFGYIGDLRSRQAALRAGFVDTDDDHIVVHWRAVVAEEEKKRLLALAASHAPF